jgi:hypothetical protein
VVALRNAEVVRNLHEAMQKHLDDIRHDTSKSTRVSVKGQKDAAITRVLTFIATMYLPASLVAVSQQNFKGLAIIDPGSRRLYSVQI